MATQIEGREIADAIRAGRLRIEEIDRELIDRAMAKMSPLVPANIRAEVRRDLERTLATNPIWASVRDEVRRRLLQEPDDKKR
jgi:hypothetical protein